MSRQPKRPVRVLEIRSVLGTGGGPEKTILLGAARSDPERYKVTVCYLRDTRDPAFSIATRAADAGVDYVEVAENSSWDYKIWPQLRRVAEARQIDIVHTHDYKTDFLGLLLAKRSGAIPLATVHGWSGHSWKERGFYYPADQFVLRFYPRIICVSADTKAALTKAGVRASGVVVVPNGIDSEHFRRQPEFEHQVRAELGLAPDAYVVGAVGRLEVEKNFGLLIRSLAELVEEGVDAHVLIAGEGSLRSQLESLAASVGVQGRCRFLGHVHDVVRLHHALDAMVLCSHNEASPNAVLEAMAMGTPVVATDVGGVSQLVDAGVHGILVQPGSGEALVQALVRLVRTPGLGASLAAAARRRAETDLSFATRMRRVEAIYDDLAADRG
jgi:glycosyltransferase involved in cell wall biosynthesis